MAGDSLSINKFIVNIALYIPDGRAADKTVYLIGAQLQEKRSEQNLVRAESINEFVERMKHLAEHDTMVRKERHISSFMRNMKKNRYTQIVLFNEGAVTLDVTKNDAKDDDYIHATKIKGKFGNYVLAQSPKRTTVDSWLRMIWQLNITIIVCLIPLVSKDKCAKYFEKKEGKKLKQKYFMIKTLASRKQGPIMTYILKVTNKYDPQERLIYVLMFTGWQEVSQKPEITELLSLLRATWALEQSNVSDKKYPTLVHGVSGTRRTGTYVLLSMLCRQMTERGELSLIPACSAVRNYRYGVMNSRFCFLILLKALLIFATDIGLINQSKQNFKTTLQISEILGKEWN
uniref:Tyrosine-protein phosphatase domain-containing protein n=1 Tax=Setaria digitata TaxID=48799 RepID=A0A915Q392_9BILA